MTPLEGDSAAMSPHDLPNAVPETVPHIRQDSVPDADHSSASENPHGHEISHEVAHEVIEEVVIVQECVPEAAAPFSSETVVPEIETGIESEIRPPVISPEVVRDRPAGSLTEFLESLLVTILLALFGTTFIVQAFKIPSESMEPTLLVGDHLLVNKFVFEGTGRWYEKLLPYRPILRGDIIVFKFPFDDHPHYVKRVIGLPGDRIHIIANQVYLNDKKLPEPYVVHDPAGDDPAVENFPPADQRVSQVGLRPEWSSEIRRFINGDELVVPAGHYFVMGDNRDRSWDSRYWGFVDRRAIMGRPVLIYWSVEATSEDYGDRSVSGSLRGIEQTLVHLPSRTRWHRMLRGVR